MRPLCPLHASAIGKFVIYTFFFRRPKKKRNFDFAHRTSFSAHKKVLHVRRRDDVTRLRVETPESRTRRFGAFRVRLYLLFIIIVFFFLNVVDRLVFKIERNCKCDPRTPRTNRVRDIIHNSTERCRFVEERRAWYADVAGGKCEKLKIKFRPTDYSNGGGYGKSRRRSNDTTRCSGENKYKLTEKKIK